MRALTGFLLCLALAGCQERSPEAPVKAGAEQSVTTVAARSEELPEHLELAGSFQPLREATLSTRLSGRILQLSGEEGDRVRAGQVVARVDLSDVEARIEQARSGQAAASAATRQAQAGISSAQAQVSQAQAQVESASRQLPEARAQLRMARLDHQRNTFLLKEGAVAQELADRSETQLRVSEARVAQLQAGVEQARAGLARARAGVSESRSAVARSQAGEGVAQAEVGAASTNLDYGILRAPFSGVITRKLAQTGEMAGPGAPLMQIQDVHQLRLEVAVPEAQLARLRLGQRMSIRVDALSASVEGVVRQIVPSADPASHSFVVKLRVANPGGRLIPGMYGRLSLAQASRKRLVIPARALVSRGQLEGVFLVSQGRAEFRLVKSRALDKDRLEVLTGLTEGEVVITEPLAGLEQGMAVKAR